MAGDRRSIEEAIATGMAAGRGLSTEALVQDVLDIPQVDAVP